MFPKVRVVQNASTRLESERVEHRKKKGLLIADNDSFKVNTEGRTGEESEVH
jgi:hypothetical protein